MERENKIAYLGISKSNRDLFNREIEVTKTCLQKYNIGLFVFVDQYSFEPEEEKQMMDCAFEEIDKCDFLIVELSKKAIGVGVEVGYAVAKGKDVIYIKRTGSKHSTTVGGCSKYQIDYPDLEYLENELDKMLASRK